MKKSFGDRLKELRGKSSQVEIAAVFGVKQQTYATWESDKYEPNITILTSICRHYKVSSDWLLGITDNHPGESLPTHATIKATRTATEGFVSAKVAEAAFAPCPTCAAKDTVIADLSACLREVSKGQGFPVRAHSSTKAPAPF